MKKVFMSLSVVTVLLFTGCASKDGYFKSIAVDKIEVDTNATKPIAVDFIDLIEPYHPAAKTIFLLDPVSKSSKFLGNMEEELRQHGYGITYDKNMNMATPLAWKIDPMGESKIRIRVTFNVASETISRQYVFNADDKLYYPTGAFTIRNLGKKYYENKLIEPEHEEIIVKPISNIEPEPSNTNNIGIVKVQPNSSLNIRDKANTKSERIGKLTLGEKIEFKMVITNAEDEKWIKLANEQGFVSAQYVAYKG